MIKRVYGSPETNSAYTEWLAIVEQHKAVLLKDGENPEDYPGRAVAYETLNFGWVLGTPDLQGKRPILSQF